MEGRKGGTVGLRVKVEVGGGMWSIPGSDVLRWFWDKPLDVGLDGLNLDSPGRNADEAIPGPETTRGCPKEGERGVGRVGLWAEGVLCSGVGASNLTRMREGEVPAVVVVPTGSVQGTRVIGGLWQAGRAVGAVVAGLAEH